MFMEGDPPVTSYVGHNGAKTSLGVPRGKNSCWPFDLDATWLLATPTLRTRPAASSLLGGEPADVGSFPACMFLSEIFRILQSSSLRLVYYTEGKDLTCLRSWLKVRVCMRTDQVRLSSVNQSGTEVKGACTGALTDASFPLPFMFPTFLHVSVVLPSFHPFLPLKFSSSLLCIFPIIHVLPFVCFLLSFPTSTQLLSSFFTSFQVSFSLFCF